MQSALALKPLLPTATAGARGRRWPRIVVLVCLAMAVVVVGGAAGLRRGDSAPGSVRHGRAGHAALARLASLPMQAQSVISATLWSGQVAFAPVRKGNAYRLAGGGVHAELGTDGVTLGSSAASESMRLSGVGRGKELNPARQSTPIAEANRVAYGGRGVQEWYAAGPLGIEQGFTVARRPAGGAGPLVIALQLGGSLHAELAGSQVDFLTKTGKLALRYGGLEALDSRGGHLWSELALSSDSLQLRVSDRGAVYPLHIDPLVEQQKVVPTDESSGASEFGRRVAVSADGDTMLVGAANDNSGVGAAWVFTRSGGEWSEQKKIVPTDETGGQSYFGSSVALSSTGDTALIGGPSDGPYHGAAWAYTRSGSTWSEQQKLVPKEEVTGSIYHFGASVALAGNGSTALIGGPGSREPGAAWVYTRAGGGWAEEKELVPSDGIRGDSCQSSEFGHSVALSSDGKTALIGGPCDSGSVGAVWVYTRSGTTWSEQTKIVPTDETTNYTGGLLGSEFGTSVALSAEGTTALVGGRLDGSGGAVWVYTGSGSTWGEQQKIVPTDATGNGGSFGASVALSEAGGVALIGSPGDGTRQIGAAWVYARLGSTWTEQSKVMPTDEKPSRFEFGSGFGDGVALSAEATTAVIGGFYDDNATGAAWAFASSGGKWSEQQKIVPTDRTLASRFGYGVALSSDGDTALVGGPYDGTSTGAVWVFVFSHGGWAEQQKIVPSDEVSGTSRFGASVALSADGNTALIGGPEEFKDGQGTAWVYTRSGSTWSMQQEIVPTDETGYFNQSEFGSSVALSADGTTALIGGPDDGAATGAAWVYTRSGTRWSEQQKLVPTDETYINSPHSRFGGSVALSADGSAALIGGPDDSLDNGAAWVYTRSGTSWSEQQKIVATDERGESKFGSSMAVSADGSSALVGGPGDNHFTGAAWVYTRAGTVWTEQQKLDPSDEIGEGEVGFTVAFSANGAVALVGGPEDSGDVGAAWVFARSGTSWSEQQKAVPSDAGGNAKVGIGVALSSDAGTALVGASDDNGEVGAAFVFGAPVTSSPTSLDFGAQTTGELGPVSWLELVNSGRDPLTFTGAAAIAGTDAGDFTIPSGDELCDGTTLDPGEGCWIGVQFTAAASGPRSAILNLGANNAIGPESVSLAGIGVEAKFGPSGATGTTGQQGPSGERGLAGEHGAVGPTGVVGATGPKGTQGPAGKVELVTCKIVAHAKANARKCKTTLVSGPPSFSTQTSVRATLLRRHHVYAIGSVSRLNGREQLVLRAVGALDAGRYTLVIRHRVGARWISTRRQVTIDAAPGKRS
jgi:hypothetical protein